MKLKTFLLEANQPSKETINWWNSHSAKAQKKWVVDNPKGEIAKLVKANVLKYGQKYGGGKSEEETQPTTEPTKTTGASQAPAKPKKQDHYGSLSSDAGKYDKWRNTTNMFNKVRIMHIIDGDYKSAALEGKIKAPGNKSSAINEIGIGVCLDHLKEKKGNITTFDLSDMLYKEMMKTKIGKSNGEEKTREACIGAACSAKREYKRIIEVLKNSNLKIDDVDISHVWGSSGSLKSAVEYLKENGIEKVNGKSLENDDPDSEDNYSKVILSGGAGENSTDTMIVLKPKGGTDAIILHTSNKVATSNIMGNSSVEKHLEMVMDEIENDKTIPRKQKEKLMLYFKEQSMKSEKIQKQISDLALKEFDSVKSKLKTPKNKKDFIDGIKNASGSSSSKAKYWLSLVKNYSDITDDRGKKVKYELTPDGKNVYAVVNDKRRLLTSTEETNVLMGFLAKAEEISLGRSKDSLSGEETKLLSKIMPPQEEAVKKLYHEYHKMNNDFRKKISKETNGKVDVHYTKIFFKRLHLTGEDKAGIPAKYFETNMGKNESRIKYDKDNNLYMYSNEGKGYYRCDENGKFIVDVKNNKNKAGKEIIGNSGTVATVMNDKTLKHCLSTYPPNDSYYKKITISDIKWEDSTSGIATIYSENKKGERFVIGYQTIRSKEGLLGKPQDTISLHKDFQTCLQLASYKLEKGLLKESKNPFTKFLKSEIVMINEEEEI